MAKLQLPELEIKLNDAQINSLVQQYIAQTYRESDIQNRIYIELAKEYYDQLPKATMNSDRVVLSDKV